MTVTSPATEARLTLNSIILTEFAPENFRVDSDRLHESLGRDGTRIGTSPIRDRPLNNNLQVLVSEILVQFYLKWRDDVDPKIKVDPATIETYAERFRRAVKRTNRVGNDRLWYFEISEISYPNDPTGNKTRFEATVEAYGNNSALIETTG